MSTAVVAGVAGGVAGALVLGAIFVRWCLWAPVLVRAEDAEKAAGEEGRPADAGPPTAFVAFRGTVGGFTDAQASEGAGFRVWVLGVRV